MKKQTVNNTAPPVIMRLYTTREVAKLWGIPYKSVKAMVHDGRLPPYVKVGRDGRLNGFELSKGDLERL